MKTLLLVVAVLITVGMSSKILVKEVTNDYEMYLAESKCVAVYIKNKVQRKDIKTSNGKCYVEYLVK